MRKKAPLFLLSACQAGCLLGNTYTTPRALPAGDLSLGAALQVGWTKSTAESPIRKRSGEAIRLSRSETQLLATPSLLQLRRGLGSGVEGGLRVAMLGQASPAAAADIKVELLRGDRLDAAVAPSFLAARTRALRAELPVRLGLRVGASHQLVLSPGGGYLSSLEDKQTSGPLARAGLGFRAAVNDRWALFPEASLSHVFAEAPTTAVVAGIGFEMTARGAP